MEPLQPKFPLVLKHSICHRSAVKMLLAYLLLLSCSSLAICSEIIGWKVPLFVVAPGGLDVPGAVRMDEPPEASPFFGEGDEIWNITALMPKLDGPLNSSPEWVIWNGTSGRFVAKGSWITMLELRRNLDLDMPPVHCRVKIDVYQIPADGSQPDASKPILQSLSFVTRTGQKTNASHSEGDISIRSETETIWMKDEPVIIFKLLAAVSVTNSTLEVDTRFVIQNNSPLWIAREFDGENGIDILVTAALELPDGTPIHELTLRQEDNVAMPFSFSKMSVGHGNIALGEGRILVWSNLPLDTLIGFLHDSSKDETDPFTDPRPYREPPFASLIDYENLKEAQAPENLAPHFQGPVIDLTGLAEDWRIDVSGDDFLGYDLKSLRAFLYSSHIHATHAFNLIFSSELGPRALNLALTSRGSGKMRLLSLSGTKASLKSTHPEANRIRIFEIEPTLDASNIYVDARVHYNEKLDDKPTSSLESKFTLEVGKFLKVFEKEKTKDPLTMIELKVDKMELNDP